MFPILTIVGGLITASPVIVAKKPNAAEIFAKIAPYQGFFGVGVLALGVIWLVRFLPLLTASLTSLGGLVVIGMIAANLLLGFLLGFGLLSGLFAKSEVAKARSELLFAKLTRVQIPLGLAAVALGALSFVL